MNRTKAFGLIAVVSTLMLTASIASAHGRSHVVSRPIKATKVHHVARVKAMASQRATSVRAVADSVVPPVPITEPPPTPSTSPYCDDDAFEGSDDGYLRQGMAPSIVVPPTGTCTYFDDDSSGSGSSSGYDD